MEGNFVRVYGSCPDRRRYEFLYLYNPRLKVAPLSLAAFFILQPETGEYHSYLFTEAFKVQIKQELYSFLNHVCDYQRFSVEARLSSERFYHLLHNLHLENFDYDYFEKLF